MNTHQLSLDQINIVNGGRDISELKSLTECLGSYGSNVSDLCIPKNQYDTCSNASWVKVQEIYNSTAVPLCDFLASNGFSVTKPAERSTKQEICNCHCSCNL